MHYFALTLSLLIACRHEIYFYFREKINILTKTILNNNNLLRHVISFKDIHRSSYLSEVSSEQVKMEATF